MSTGTTPSRSVFDAVVGDWFQRSVGEPTRAQAETWPLVAAGRHVLVSAPTGSGKTLAAFLWPLNQLLTGAWNAGVVRVLYVSPLKALNNDIERNLIAPLAQLENAFALAGRQAAPVRVATRSGDTPSRERQAMLRQPPEILITTPESLNLLLTSPRGRGLFSSLEMVILDEIHAVAASKRGTHLITAVDRLVPLAGEFQRLALSATVRPIERVAEFVGGYELTRSDGEPFYRARAVELVRGEAAKRYELEVCRPQEVADAIAASDEPDGPPANIWESLTSDFRRRIRRNRSTLLFANNRRTTERLTRLLNEGVRQALVYSHHGSLSREIRSLVEQRLKDGELKALVATNSLELGIDVGALDEVLLVKTPPSIASAVQRIGRAGHSVGEVSRGRFYPLFGRDLLEAAVVARAVDEHDIEAIRPIEGALDVLAQVVLSMTANETWQVDEIFDQLRSSAPYRRLSRRQFDLVIEMLTGRYADSRVRELAPRIAFDRIDGTVRGRPGTARLVYQSGGTIPDRGYYHLRLHESMAKLGELDEEFVWERSLGDTFTLGAQAWRIRAITHSDVLVAPVKRSAAMAPFWRSEERDRSFHLSERIGQFLEDADTVLRSRRGVDDLARRLGEKHHMAPAAAKALLELLERQRSAAGGSLPHRHHLLVERTSAKRNEPGRTEFTIHTGWGGRVNRPFAIALSVAWEERHQVPLEIEHDNDCLLVAAAGGFDFDELLELVRPDNLEDLLRCRLASTGYFGARFRESAGRALLLPRSGAKRRVPLWLQRERGKKLLTAVVRYQDFPIVLETWRVCLHDEFEIEILKRLLTEVADGTIRVSETTSDSPSPFAADLRWKQTNRLMYEDDTPEPGGRGTLAAELLREVAFSSSLRPDLPAALVAEFESKLRRLHPGYAPKTAGEVVEWIKERLLVPRSEWLDLEAAVARELEPGGEEIAAAIDMAGRKLTWIGIGEGAIVARENLPRLARAFGATPSDLEVDAAGESVPVDAGDTRDAELLEQVVAEWLRFYGPVAPARIERAFGLEKRELEEILESLSEAQQVVIDRFRKGARAAIEVCDAENLERLLRLQRARSRPSLAPRTLEELPLFLATYQGLSKRPGGVDDLKRVIEQQLLWPAPARHWETEVFPARLDPYFPEWLDSLMQESDLMWLGCGPERLCFGFPSEIDLLGAGAGSGSVEERARVDDELSALFADERGRYRFSELLKRAESSTELSDRLWRGVWAGGVSNTTFSALRKGILGRFRITPDEVARPARRGRRGGYDRWQASRPFSGDWFRLPRPSAPGDVLEQEDLSRERVRVLLDRYGVIFRELLSRELPAFRWGAVFRSLRLMELSGEVVSGHFFAGIPGLQFATRTAVRLLQDGLPEDAVYWLNAADPASPSGLGLSFSKGALPARRASNHLVFHGSRPVVLSRGGGARLTIRVGPDHPDLERYVEFLRVRLSRRFDPVKAVDIETINGKPAAASPYAQGLSEVFATTRERGGLRLRRRY